MFNPYTKRGTHLNIYAIIEKEQVIIKTCKKYADNNKATT